MNTELLDLSTKSSCYVAPSFPYEMYDGFGGLLGTNIALICGGYDAQNGQKSDDCHFWDMENGETFITSAPLLEPRHRGDSITTTKGLWVTGGLNANNVVTKTTEFVTLDESIVGPNLPEPISDHCLARINSTVIALIGGDTGTYSAKTYFFDERSQDWTSGPNMIEARYLHGCSVITNNGKQYLTVAGGYNNGKLDSLEFLEIGAETAAWVKGPALPEPISDFRMVLTADSLGLIAIGGYDDSTLNKTRVSEM